MFEVGDKAVFRDAHDFAVGEIDHPRSVIFYRREDINRAVETHAKLGSDQLWNTVVLYSDRFNDLAQMWASTDPCATSTSEFVRLA